MPDNVRVLRGNPGNHPAPKRVRMAPAAPAPPTTLTREAAAEWKRIVPELNRHGLLAAVDRAVLTAYCEAWAKLQLAEKEIRRGIVLKGRDGGSVKNPAWQPWREATTLVHALAKELMLTPLARLRSTLPEAPDEKKGTSIFD